MKQTTVSSVIPTIQLLESRTRIDQLLKPLIKAKVETASSIDGAYAALWHSIELLYSAGGKRLRSYMTLLVYQAYKNDSYEAIIPAAAAQELLHLAMLIHDDIIDRDDFRYGIKNIHAQYLDIYRPFIADIEERRHYSQSSALLAGDLLIAESFVLVSQADINPSAALAAQQLLGNAIFRVIGGELIDTEAVFKGDSAAHPLTIAEQKTASYSFVGPFLMGATLAEAPDQQKQLLNQLGTQLGVAYQIRDDLMGVFGDESLTGKSTEGDIREGKRTLLIEEFYRIATEEEQTSFKVIFGNIHATPSEIASVRQLLIRSGAKKSIEGMIIQYQKSCVELVEQLDIEPASRQAFRELIDICLQREQ